MKTLMATLETSEITMHNLKPSTKYTVCLSVRTTGGTTTSNPQTVQTLAVSKYTYHMNKTPQDNLLISRI